MPKHFKQFIRAMNSRYVEEDRRITDMGKTENRKWTA